MTSQEVLNTYENIAGITERMLQAARDSDWDRLVLLEQECAAQVSHLRADAALAALSGGDQRRKVDVLRKILDDDRQIRDLAMPWMAQLSALLNNSGTQRRLAGAYGAV